MNERQGRDQPDIPVTRNRIAHHEPVFARNLQSDYEAILFLLSARSYDVAQWLEENQKLTELLKAHT